MPPSLHVRARVWHVDPRHPRASDVGDGSGDAPLRCISEAAFRAEPGDTVRVFPGVYRERVAPRRGGREGAPIVYESAVRHAAVIKASEVWRPAWRELGPGAAGTVQGWAPLDPAMFSVDRRQAIDWPDAAFPARFNPFEHTLHHALKGQGPAEDFLGRTHGSAAASPSDRRITLGQLFVDGAPLRQEADEAAARETPGTFAVVCAPAGGLGLRVHFPLGVGDPSGCLLEVTARPRCFAAYRRGLGHVVVRGFVMEHGASDFPGGFYRPGQPPQAGILSTRGGRHWVIEHNVVRWGTSVGLDLGTEGVEDADGLGQPEPETGGDHAVRFNTISDHGCGGIAGPRAARTVIAHNVIERNNRLGFTAAEIGAIKLHFFVDGVIEHNLIRDNDCFGLWLDHVFHRARVHGNLLVNNQGAGVFVELGHGPATIDHNVIAHTRAGSHTSGAGDGLYAHDASGVTFAHNLCLFNAGHGLYAHLATDRAPRVFAGGGPTGERRPSACSGWRVVGNLFFGQPLPAVALPPDADRSRDNRCDHNAYAGSLPRGTLETFAAALEPARFALPHNKGRVDASAPPADSPALAPPAELDLEAWRALTGRDEHSVQATVVRATYSRLSATLAMIVGPQVEAASPPAWTGGTADYFGRPREGAGLPGPFASMVIDPRLVSPGEVDPADDLPGRGPFHGVDLSRRFVASLWPKPLPVLRPVGREGSAEP